MKPQTKWWISGGCHVQPLSPDLLQLLQPTAQAVHLHALLAVLGLQLRDGLFLLGGRQLDLLQGATQEAQLLLQRGDVFLLLGEEQRRRALTKFNVNS